MILHTKISTNYSLAAMTEVALSATVIRHHNLSMSKHLTTVNRVLLPLLIYQWRYHSK